MLYQTQGTCSKFIDVETDADGRISHCYFHGGCPGNTQGLARLVIGKTPEEVKRLLDGIRCGSKPTSCPDQLCRALEQLEK
ncbi:MAG: TIGR03905 family TSCPD domain-containing protein [Bacteroidaceae bacterium]|nr:TIGR03905 family TSCPD domain-containing protein [Bacteroidaceae bacterium]